MHRTASEPEWKSRLPENDQKSSALSRRKLLLIAGVVLVALLAAVVAFEYLWPFTPRGLARRLQQYSSATIEFGSFHRLFFPHPGFVAERVVVRPSASAPPSATMSRLTVRATYSGLVGSIKSLSQLKAEGLVVNVFTGGEAQNLKFRRSERASGEVRVEQLVADGATLQVSSGPTKKPLVFRLWRLRLSNLGNRSTPGYLNVALQNPLPTMQIAATGHIGPWHVENVLRTPVSGSFSVQDGRLSDIPPLQGKLTSSGQFRGDMEQIDISGRADVAGFEVQSPDHPMPLRVRFDSAMNTKMAQLTLRSIDAQLAATSIQGSGTIFAGRQPSPHAASLALDCRDGRVDDLLRLFTSSPRPSMVGPIRFHTEVYVERGNQRFLERVLLNGNFLINNARFTSPVTQHKLNTLSARSKGNSEQETPPLRTATLSSHVAMRDGVAHLSDIRFLVQGASARGAGTFNALDKRVDFKGRLRMQAELSETSKGVKSVFLKLLDPFFNEPSAGAEVPVEVTGTAQRARFKASLK